MSRENIPTALRLRGRIDMAALEDALAFLIQRHEVLRAQYVLQHGIPLQVRTLSACQMRLIVRCVRTRVSLYTDCITPNESLCCKETPGLSWTCVKSSLNCEGMAKILRAQVIGPPKRLSVTRKRPEPNTQLQLMSCLQNEAAHRFDLEHDSALVGGLKCVKCL